MLAITTLMASILATNAHTPPKTLTTFAYVVASPNPWVAVNPYLL
jgi:hypothetical protein